MLAAPAAATSDYERDVLAALNAARADPATYARGLAGYGRLYHGRMIALPNDPVRVRTVEGVRPLGEAVSFLSVQPALPTLAPSELLAAAAEDHVDAQSASGETGHDERGGIGPAERLRAHGGGGQIGEVIAYGARDPADVIRQLVIDDGVPGRGHRRLLFDPGLRFAGVACGRHRVYRTMCVIDLSRSWNGGSAESPADWARRRAADFAARMKGVFGR